FQRVSVADRSVDGKKHNKSIGFSQNSVLAASSKSTGFRCTKNEMRPIHLPEMRRLLQNHLAFG
ncbi:MAG TPA: hypothetical protein VN836_11100, partial [Verrucomicrobiae bacterium]|nr:hypothetical protein [Verrucomicrobiae bacterium]